MDYPELPSQSFRVQTLAPVLIIVLVIATLQPLLVIFTTTMPWTFEDIGWRVRFYGFLLGSTPQLAFCLVLLSCVALFSEQHRAIRVASITALLLGVLLIPLVMLDVLDVTEMQAQVSMDQLRQYRITALQSWAMVAVLIPALIVMGLRGLKAGRKPPRIDTEDALLLDKEPLPGPLDPRVTN